MLGESCFALDVGVATRPQGNVGFYNAAPLTKQTVTGAKSSNTALVNVLQAL